MNEIENKSTETQTLNQLLRAELSAVEAYQQFFEKLGTGFEEAQQVVIARIRQIQEEHREAARLLSAQVCENGGTPSEEPSTWKNLTVLIEQAENPLADPMAIKALKEGEEQDVLTYRTALGNGGLTDEIKEFISGKLLPRSEAHLPLLDEILAAA